MDDESTHDQHSLVSHIQRREAEEDEEALIREMAKQMEAEREVQTYLSSMMDEQNQLRSQGGPQTLEDHSSHQMTQPFYAQSKYRLHFDLQLAGHQVHFELFGT